MRRVVHISDLHFGRTDEQVVAALLRVDHGADREVREQRDDDRQRDRRTDADEELFPAPLAERLPPGQ